MGVLPKSEGVWLVIPHPGTAAKGNRDSTKHNDSISRRNLTSSSHVGLL